MRRILFCPSYRLFVDWVANLSLAQSGLPGFTLFWCQERNQLPFRLDFGGQSNGWDRYRLRIPAKKLKLAAAQFTIT